MIGEATIPLDVLTDATRARVLDEYRAHLKGCTRPLTYAEASFYYGITSGTLRRYVWLGRVQATPGKAGGHRGYVTHEEMRRFCACYKPKCQLEYPRTITMKRAA